MILNLRSETGRLNGVIVHTPGREVSLVHPDRMHELLFDDIIFEEEARHEHLGMRALFEAAVPAGGTVLEITDLIAETFAQADARADFAELLVRRLPEYHLGVWRDRMADLAPAALTAFAVQGRSADLPGLVLPPSPNLLFTRDLAAVVRDRIVLSRAAKPARARESILMDVLVRHHPLFAGIRDRAIRIPAYDTIEGGDILVASEDVVLIGMSERTSFSGVMQAGASLLDAGVRDVLIVDIPKQRASMHLDTIFTFTRPDECIAFPPAIQDRTHNVVRLSRDGDRLVTELMPSLHRALETCLQRDMTFIACGGAEPLNQHREQWSDGANLFCLAPGVVVGYERNTNTYRTLQEHGYELLTQEAFLDRYRNTPFDPGTDSRIAVSFVGHELCRGRGGARCMTLPISRLD